MGAPAALSFTCNKFISCTLALTTHIKSTYSDDIVNNIVFSLGSSPDLAMVKRYIQVLQILLVQLPRPSKYYCCFCRYVNN